MKEENKKNKKKVLLYYLILAACLLVIAAVTVTVIFTVNRNSGPDISIDNPDDPNKDNDNPGNTGDNGDNTDNNNGDNTGKDPEKPDNNKPTSSDTSFILPVKSANVTTGYDFTYDVTLDRYCVHRGMDFDGTAGDSVCAVLDGVVTKIVTGHKLGENYVTISHANGLTTTYKYIEVKDSLKEGANVKGGDVIGTIAAASGMEMKQGDHLHFEVTVNGLQADPDVYLNIAEK